MPCDALLFELYAAMRGGMARDDRDALRDLRDYPDELLADSSNRRRYDLFFDLSCRELRVLPCFTAGDLLLLPLDGLCEGLEGVCALDECLDALEQRLSVPKICRLAHPEFYAALEEAAARSSASPQATRGGANDCPEDLNGCPRQAGGASDVR